MAKSRRSSRKVSKRSRKGSRKLSRRSKSKKQCSSLLSRKIKKNMGEMHDGRFGSRGQAIAVSYSQIKGKFPSCKKYFSK